MIFTKYISFAVAEVLEALVRYGLREPQPPKREYIIGSKYKSVWYNYYFYQKQSALTKI